MRSSWLRMLPPLALLMVAGAFLHSRTGPERIPPYRQLSAFPLQAGEWLGTDVPISEDVLESLGKGDFLQRHYTRGESDPPLDLFLAFFPSQVAGNTVHSPQHCLPGWGWSPVEHGLLRLSRPTGGTLTVNRYLVERAGNRDLVLYWYQSCGRVIASEYWAKFYLMINLIRWNRSDGGFVRIVTPVIPNEALSGAQQRAVAFADKIVPQLDAYIPD